jgi:hypothetical protein
MAEDKPKRRNRRPKRGRRERSLAGTNLRREASGTLIWRKVHPLTGQRVSRSCGTHVLSEAFKRVADFEREMRAEALGIQTFSRWKIELEPLVDQWIEYLRTSNPGRCPTERWLKEKQSSVKRVLRDLKLVRAADLTAVAKIDLRTRALEGRIPPGGRRKLTLKTLRQKYQGELKRFSAWLTGNHRYLSRDPLVDWIPIQAGPAGTPHRCYGPDEFARALWGVDQLHALHSEGFKGQAGNRRSPRVFFEMLLVTGARFTALASRGLEDFLVEDGRIDLGEGRGKKRRGEAALDRPRWDALVDYVGEREEGCLFLSPWGKQIRHRRTLEAWREAFGLGVVREFWPEDREWHLETAYLANRALIRGRVNVNKGGNPTRGSVETKRRRRKKLAKGRSVVAAIVEEIRDQWEERNERVTFHSFRYSHETWAKAKHVEQVLINKQCGWKASARNMDLDAARIAQASQTGLAIYLDLGSDLLDARKSAEAVGELLDGALAGLSQANGRSLGVKGEKLA